VCTVALLVLCYMCRDPLPLSVIHIPICISFAFFDDGKFMLVDPTQREHLVADGMVVVAMNKHREICMVEMSGCVLLVLEQVNSLSLIIISGGGEVICVPVALSASTSANTQVEGNQRSNLI